MVDPQVIWDYRRDLEQLARRLCRNPHDAEDVTQTALMKAVQGKSGFRGEATVRTWLHRIATNECLMMQRRKRPGSLDQMMETDGAAEAHARTGSARAPEEMALVSETQGEVLAALERLPDHRRNAVMLVDGCGMSYAEAAQALGTTPAAVRSTLFRARRSLREDLADVERT